MKKTITLFLALLCGAGAFSQTAPISALTKKVQGIIATTDGDIGVAIKKLGTNDSVVINGSKHYPMQSVFKFPLALAALDMVDQSKLSLGEKIRIPRESVDTTTWSPMLKDHPKGDIEVTLSELLIYAVSKSDNNACDALFQLSGGTKHVNDFIHNLGVTGINIAATEGEMKQNWLVQYSNWCEPVAMLHLLELFNDAKTVSRMNNFLLMRMMIESQNPTTRIKALLPEKTTVAHKTGSSDTNSDGLTAATNDVGIVTLPDGSAFAIVVYVSNSKAKPEKSEHVIAEIAKAAWDYYTAGK